MTYKMRYKVKIPCVYKGSHQVQLFKYGGPYQDKDGKVLTNLVLNPGDTLMLEEEEVCGYTLLLDPNHVNDPIKLGIGKVILDADKDKDPEILYRMGYQFHEGRTDFAPYVSPAMNRSIEKVKKEGDN